MARQTDSVLSKSLQGWARIHNEYLNVAERVPYKWGASLTSVDAAGMKLRFDHNADIDFWKPADASTIRALEDVLKENSWVLEILRNGADECKKELTECPYPTIDDGYSACKQYSRLLRCVFDEGVRGLTDSFGDNLFRVYGCVPIRISSLA